MRKSELPSWLPDQWKHLQAGTAPFVASWIGIAGQNTPLHRRLAYEYKLPIDTAIMVNDVQKSSPAAQAGIRSGDIIVAFGPTPIAGIDELHRLLTAEAANRSTTFTILRGVERKQLRVTPLSKED